MFWGVFHEYKDVFIRITLYTEAGAWGSFLQKPSFPDILRNFFCIIHGKTPLLESLFQSPATLSKRDSNAGFFL